MSARQRTCLGGGATLALVVGLVVGWVLAGGGRPVVLRAGAGDHADASIVATGAVELEKDRNGTVFTKDAVYYLNYSRGRLLAAVPFPLQTAGSSRVLSEFAERDLVQDFGLTPGRSYHFAMTTGSIGGMNGGVAPLYVFETTTGQLGVYQARLQFVAGSTRPGLDLVERRQDPALARAERQVAAAPAR